MNRFDELKESFCETTVKFVHTELDVAITFCEMAQSTHVTHRYNQNLEHAQKAYLSAKRLTPLIRTWLASGQPLMAIRRFPMKISNI
jgi:hypothetical protein